MISIDGLRERLISTLRRLLSWLEGDAGSRPQPGSRPKRQPPPLPTRQPQGDYERVPTLRPPIQPRSAPAITEPEGSTLSFRFVPGKGGWWEGRYNRIPGKSSVFSVKRKGAQWLPSIEWWDNNELRCVCPAVPSSDMIALAQMVNNAKTAMGGKPGGSFLINEFQQVLVPSNSNWGDRAYIGEIRGMMCFKNPRTDKIFSIDDARGLTPGARWDRPYVGMCFQLRSDDKLAMKISETERDRLVFPPKQDTKLIRALRSVRPQGACRFVVTPQGLVLTKRESRHGDWEPIYVGRINYQKWFVKEPKA